MITAEQLLAPTSQPATLDQPIDHLVACHRRIEQRLAALVRAGEVLESRPVDALGAIHSALLFLDHSGNLHTADEEQSVFPRLRLLVSDEERTYLESLEQDHRQADEAATELKAVVRELFDAVTSERVDRYRRAARRLNGHYAAHIQSEDQVLTAIARRTLDGTTLETIASEMKARRRA